MFNKQVAGYCSGRFFFFFWPEVVRVTEQYKGKALDLMKK